MKLLKEIVHPDYGVEEDFKIRKASRGILLDNEKRIPLLFVSKYNYHKLPGGGIDEGEDRLSALKREILEETGCTIRTKGEIGEIIEHKTRFNIKQISYCYFGEILTIGDPNFTEKELDNGFRIVWKTLEESIKTLKQDKPTNYEGEFIQKRDTIFLEEYKRMSYQKS